MASINTLASRYQDWESRTAGRFQTWSVGRRWAVFVLLPALMCCCAGAVISAPLTWLIGQTIEAGKGAPDAQAAVNIYLLALGYNNPDGLLPIVGNSDELIDQWKAYRAEMERVDPVPSTLGFNYGPTSQDGGRAQVTADVYFTWWNTDGRAGGWTGSAHRWHFTTHEDDGWRTETV